MADDACCRATLGRLDADLARARSLVEGLEMTRAQLVACLGGAASEPLLDALRAYWKLDEASGSRADSSDAGLTLADHNAVGSVAGVVGDAANFVAASAQYLSHADDPAFSPGTGAFTWAGWVKLGSAAYTPIAQKWGRAGNQREWFLGYVAAPTNAFFVNVSGDGATTALSLPASTFGAAVGGTWYFLAWSIAADGTVSISVNAGTPDTGSIVGGVFEGTGELELGADADGADFHDVSVDEVGIWGRVLTAAELARLYGGGAGLTYPF